jgi:hypothetical protein
MRHWGPEPRALGLIVGVDPNYARLASHKMGQNET